MKIIGITNDSSNCRKYLVEATQDELINVAGHAWGPPLREIQPGAFDRDGYLKIGAEISVARSFDYLKKLRENDASCRGAAKLLHGMADMIDGALPTTIIPPDEPAAE